MARRAIAEEIRKIVTVADDDTDIPDALRLIANMLESDGGSLQSIGLVVGSYEGTEELPEPEVDEEGREIAPSSVNAAPRRVDIRVEAEIRSGIYG